MNLAARHQPGVPTTPPPQKPAPNPRYNDLTRPRSLRLDAEHQEEQQAHATSADRRGHFWGSAPGEANLHLCGRVKGGGAASSPLFEQQRRTSSSSSDPDFPLPWQGKIDLPESDEEIMNAAQTWITQVLHENGENLSDDDNTNLSTDVLLNGRVLCLLANGIAPGSVEAVFEEEADNTRDLCSFLIACRKLGVPAGALFDTVDPDPRRVGLCLHVLSAVVRDTVPAFAGPFLATGPSGRSSPIAITGDGGEEGEDDSSGDENPKASNNSNNHHSHHHNNDTLVSQEQTGPGARSKTSQKRSSRRTAAGAVDIDIFQSADEVDTEYNEQCQQQQEHQQRYQGSHQQHIEPRPPIPPAARPRPLSFPSRFSPDAPGDEDAMWNSLFPSPASLARTGGATTPVSGRDVGEGGAGYRDAADGATWCATKGMVAEPPHGQGGISESLAIIAPRPGAAAATLSAWLLNLNLNAFEGALVNIGVETMGDLRYVEEQDLHTIGMHGPQIRKLLQNRP